MGRISRSRIWFGFLISYINKNILYNKRDENNCFLIAGTSLEPYKLQRNK